MSGLRGGKGAGPKPKRAARHGPGEGLDLAVQGAKTIIHCASSPFRKVRQTDVEGTRRLLDAAAKAGDSHVVYISIVGLDRVPSYPVPSYPYYRVKLETERVIEGSPLPYTILRATQFYELVSMAVRFLERMPVMVVPNGFPGQPIDAGEVAGRLVELVLSEPAGRVADIGDQRSGRWPTSCAVTSRSRGSERGRWCFGCLARQLERSARGR